MRHTSWCFGRCYDPNSVLADLRLLGLLRMRVLRCALLSLNMLLLKQLLRLGLSLGWMLLGLGLLLGLLLLWLLLLHTLLLVGSLDLTCHSSIVTLNPLQKPETWD